MAQNIISLVQSLQGIEQKKSFLRQFTNQYRAKIEAAGLNTNDLLIKAYHAAGATELDTYKGWAKKGRKVKKGAKALILWSAPIRKKKENEGNETEESGKAFFMVAHVFDVSETEAV